MMKPDPLTPTERALVEARVAAQDITRLPMGASSFEAPVWDDQARRLVFKGGAALYRKQHSAQFGRSPRPGPSPKIPAHLAERRARVATLHAQGKTMAEMVRAIGGVSPSSIRNDHDCLGLVPNAWTHPNPVDQAARLEHVRNLAAQGLTAQEISAKVGVYRLTILRLAAANGFKITRPKRGDAGSEKGFRPVGAIADQMVQDLKRSA